MALTLAVHLVFCKGVCGPYLNPKPVVEYVYGPTDDFLRQF